MSAAGPDAEEPLDSLVEELDDSTARRLLALAAEAHEDVARRVRLAAAGRGERLDVLRAEVDGGLRTRRHLDYWQSGEWATEAAPVLDALADEVAREPTDELVRLLERAAGHLVKVILRADDSNGMIGDLAAQALDLHRQACAPGVEDPKALAKWMIRFSFRDQDFFHVDPVAYATALGEGGLALYRREVAKLSQGSDATSEAEPWRPYPSFAARYANERLAVLDRDTGRIVELLGGDLTSPHQYQQVSDAMLEIDRLDDALAWARRGIEATNGWQVAKLYDLAAGIHAGRGQLAEIVELRREQHHRMPSSTTYATLKAAATATSTWPDHVDAARSALADHNPVAFIDALLADDEPDAAWTVATSSHRELDPSQWLRLARARQPGHPADAMAIYLRLADDALLSADRRNYRDATRHLKAARAAAAAAAADATPTFEHHLEHIRDRYRRRPTLIAMLDKAGLT